MNDPNRLRGATPAPPATAPKPDVFEAAKLGPVTLRNRTIKAATYEGLTKDGQVTDALIDFHVRHARGGVGMTTVAYCAVAPEGRTDRRQIHWRDEAMPGLRKLTDAVHAEGRPSRRRSGTPARSPTPRATSFPRSRPAATST
ncbi:hypothetical protein ACFQY7_28915 [Actinomadura luteofluorescens]|uniref:oxidoreductase n=1 Tax=Actinomadura luteofluorescens TaxID=46163 RepID=UPI003628AE96